MKKFLPFVFLLTLGACASEPESVMLVPVYEYPAPVYVYPEPQHIYPEPASIWQDPPPLVPCARPTQSNDYVGRDEYEYVIAQISDAIASTPMPATAAPSFNRVGVYTNRPR